MKWLIFLEVIRMEKYKIPKNSFSGMDGVPEILFGFQQLWLRDYTFYWLSSFITLPFGIPEPPWLKKIKSGYIRNLHICWWFSALSYSLFFSVFSIRPYVQRIWDYGEVYYCILLRSCHSCGIFTCSIKREKVVWVYKQQMLSKNQKSREKRCFLKRFGHWHID